MYRFARVISGYVNLSSLDVNNICCVQLWVDSDIAFKNHQFWLHHYKITEKLMSSLEGKSMG